MERGDDLSKRDHTPIQDVSQDSILQSHNYLGRLWDCLF